MAFKAGHNATLSIDGTVVTTYTNDTTLSRIRETLETTVFGNTDRTYIAGVRGHTIACSGFYDPTGDAVFVGADDGATVLFDYSPDGTVNYTGSAMFSQYDVQSVATGDSTWTANFTPTGTVSRA